MYALIVTGGALTLTPYYLHTAMTPQEIAEADLRATYNSLVSRMQGAERLLRDSTYTMQAAQEALATSPPSMRQAAMQILSDSIANHQAVEAELMEATAALIRFRLQHPQLPQHS